VVKTVKVELGFIYGESSIIDAGQDAIITVKPSEVTILGPHADLHYVAVKSVTVTFPEVEREQYG